MKMKMRTMTIKTLQEIYTRPSIRAEGNGFYLRKVGHFEYKTNPDLQIHIPCLGVPVENDEPIDLMRGFVNMSKIAEVMNLALNHVTGFLFCKNFFINDENSHRSVCHVTLCDPEEAQYILIIAAFENPSSTPIDSMFGYDGVWHGFSYRRSTRQQMPYTERYAYSLVPIGFCVPEDETQTSEVMEKTKREVVCLANQYLGIETEEAAGVEFGDNKDAGEEPPGTILTNESLYLWAYEDDLSAEDSWVIDRCGRMLAPTAVQDHKDKYLGAKVAEYRTWEKIPEGALVLSWSKPSIASAHVFIVNIKPELVTCAQLERAAWLEDQIEKRYERRCSPYAGGKSPDIQDGWGLWEHR